MTPNRGMALFVKLLWPLVEKPLAVPGSVDFSDIQIVHKLQGEWPQTQISRARCYLTLNISQTIQDRTHGYCRPLLESDMWPIKVCHRQWLWSTFKVISAILCEKKCSLLFWCLTKSPGDLMKNDTADELEWVLKVISGTLNGFNVCISEIQRTRWGIITGPPALNGTT